MKYEFKDGDEVVYNGEKGKIIFAGMGDPFWKMNFD